MAKWKYTDDKKGVFLGDDRPKRRKKVTGTRFGAVLGLNRWKSPFGAWCEITNMATPPFEGNASTNAGNVIEPKQIAWYKENVNPSTTSAEDYYGARFPDVRYDFYPENKIFGGMWDAVTMKGDGHTPRGIIECKTTKRVEDWLDGVPVYYSLQAALYAYLSGCDRFTVVVSFLQDRDLERPELFVPNEENTKVFDFMLYDYAVTVDGKSYGIADLVDVAQAWYTTYVDSGVSPAFNEKQDKEYLGILRKADPTNDQNLLEMGLRATEIRAKIALLKKESGLDALEKEKKVIEAALKDALIEELSDTDESSEIAGWVLKREMKEKLNEAKLKEDGVYEQYLITETSFKLTQKKEK